MGGMSEPERSPGQWSSGWNTEIEKLNFNSVFPLCVFFLAHTGHFIYDTLVTKCVEGFLHKKKQVFMTPTGCPTI